MSNPAKLAYLYKAEVEIFGHHVGANATLGGIPGSVTVTSEIDGKPLATRIKLESGETFARNCTTKLPVWDLIDKGKSEAKTKPSTKDKK